MEKLVFSSVVYANEFSERGAILLAESVRAFAGGVSRAPIWYFIPDYGKKLSAHAEKKFKEFDVTLFHFAVDADVLKFPFTGDVLAAERAETEASGKAVILAWLGSNTIILKEPGQFVLAPKTVLGYRPVHHTLIGSRYEKPVDLFWTLVYDWCEVPGEMIFPMTAHIDGLKIRPYFNAGYLIVRPEKRLFQAWRGKFFDLYRKPDFQEFYEKDERYAIFMHQAVLSGVILATLSTEEIVVLSPSHNYPLHLFGEDVTTDRPENMDGLITARHEGLDDPEWMRIMPMSDALYQWMVKRTTRIREKGKRRK